MTKTITLNANARAGQGAKIDCSNLTMIQVDIIQMDDYPAESCAISPTAFLLSAVSSSWYNTTCRTSILGDQKKSDIGQC